MSICARTDVPRSGALGKRKEREYSSSSEQRQALFPPPPGKPELRNKPHQLSRFANKPPMPTPPPQGGSSKLLAGYLAHEFLKFGTLLGAGRRPPRRACTRTREEVRRGVDAAHGGRDPHPRGCQPDAARPLAPDKGVMEARARRRPLAGGGSRPGAYRVHSFRGARPGGDDFWT